MTARQNKALAEAEKKLREVAEHCYNIVAFADKFMEGWDPNTPDRLLEGAELEHAVQIVGLDAFARHHLYEAALAYGKAKAKTVKTAKSRRKKKS